MSREPDDSFASKALPDVLPEILEALEMPRSGLRTWFSHLQGFCRAHGGERYYSRLMDLVSDCQSQLESQELHAHQRTGPTHR